MYDEAFATAGVPRNHYAALLDALAGTDLSRLRAAVNTRLHRDGVRFSSGDDDRFVVDPIPRILLADEWDALAAGLEQRVRALNAFVRDAYGPRRIVAAGHITDDVIESAEGYEPDLRGRLPDTAAPIGVAGLDIVRDPDGTLCVLEDNLRTPSGLTYAVAARAAVQAELPPGGPEPRAIGDAAFRGLDEVLRAAAGSDDPFVVVLTDTGGSAAWEHAEIARRLGAPARHPRRPAPARGARRGAGRGRAPAPRRRRVPPHGRGPACARRTARRPRSGRRSSTRGSTGRSRSSTRSAPASPTTSSCTATSRR
jgi:carboxylate-amine ligase